MKDSDIKLSLYQCYRDLQEEHGQVLGYDWLIQAEVDYIPGKRVMALMEGQGLIESDGRLKNRRGRPGQYWVVTEKGWADNLSLANKANAEYEGTLLQRLTEGSGKIRVKLPCDRNVWKEITALGKAGKIHVVVVLED